MLLGLGLGPYVVGLVSDVTRDLRFARITTIVVLPIILGSILMALRDVPALEASLVDRTRAAGEGIQRAVTRGTAARCRVRSADQLTPTR